jgi:hypothetical protein
MRAEGDHYGHFLNEGPLYTGIYKMKELASILAAITAALLAGTAIAAPKPSPGTQVVDSRGTVVGTIVGADPTNDITVVARQTDKGGWISFSLATFDNGGGIVTYNTPDLNPVIPFLYTNSNCTGTAYMLVYGLPQVSVPISTLTPNGVPSPTATVYFPGTPFQPLVFGSFWTLAPFGGCVVSNISQHGLLVGQVQSISLSFVLPFTVQ